MAKYAKVLFFPNLLLVHWLIYSLEDTLHGPSGFCHHYSPGQNIDTGSLQAGFCQDALSSRLRRDDGIDGGLAFDIHVCWYVASNGIGPI